MSQYISKIIRHVSNKRYIQKNEHIYDQKLKYLYIDKKNNSPDTLMIVFSAFTGDTPRYNYFSSFKNVEIGQLYILDNFGFKGSYYWMEDGSHEPESITLTLIRNIVEKYGYKKIITVGTSKGGTAAIYFGLEINATHIFSGACQYYVGSYLNRDSHMEILKRMIGDNDLEEQVQYLDNKLYSQIVKYKSNHGLIHLFYSKNELTYERQTIHLINTLKQNGYDFEEEIACFDDHSVVGTYFIPYMQNWFKNNGY